MQVAMVAFHDSMHAKMRVIVRPECMAALGLSPPYTIQDIHQAYLARVKGAHPDTGGNMAAFLNLQTAYDCANEYVRRHPFRLTWLANDVEFYIKQRAWIARLRDYDATVEIQQNRGLASSWGEDFIHLRDRVVSIHMHGSTVTDEVIGVLIHDRRLLGHLRILDLGSSKVTDHGLGTLPALESLQSLILCDTLVIGRGLAKTVGRLPNLHVIDLRNTPVRWTTLIRLRWSFPSLRALSGQLTRQLALPAVAT
jgi:hypothetical protein